MADFQPGEETAEGAQAMIDDGLFKRFPKPDVVLGQHVMVGPSGTVAGRAGAITSAAQLADSALRAVRAAFAAGSTHCLCHPVACEMIADTAGVSQATIFRHFSTKAALWIATAHWIEEELDKIWARSHADVTSDKALLVLEEIFVGMVEFFARYPAVVRIMMSDCLRHEFSGVVEIAQTLHQRYQREIVRLLELAIKAKLANGALDRKAAATLFVCCIRGLGFQIAMSGGSPRFRKEANQVLQLYFRAIGAAQGI